jgi:hypothetical protein
MIEREEEIRHCIITCLVSCKFESFISKEGNSMNNMCAKKEFILKNLSPLPDNENQIQDVQPILDSVFLLSDVVTLIGT